MWALTMLLCNPHHPVTVCGSLADHLFNRYSQIPRIFSKGNASTRPRVYYKHGLSTALFHRRGCRRGERGVPVYGTPFLKDLGRRDLSPPSCHVWSSVYSCPRWWKRFIEWFYRMSRISALIARYFNGDTTNGCHFKTPLIIIKGFFSPLQFWSIQWQHS